MAFFDCGFELNLLRDLDRAIYESIRQSGSNMDVCYSTNSLALFMCLALLGINNMRTAFTC